MIQTNNVMNKTIINSIYLFFGSMANFVSSMMISIIIIRTLGPIDYGLYSILYSVPTLLIIISDLGLSQSLLRYVSKYSENKNDSLSVIGVVFFIKIISSSIIFIIINIFASNISILLNRLEISSYMLIISIFFISGSYTNAFQNSLIGLDKTKEYSIIMFLLSIINFIIIFLNTNTTSNLSDVLILITINNLLNISVFMIYLLYNFKSFNVNRFNSIYKNMLKEIMIYSYPLYFSSLIVKGSSHMLQLILARIVSNYEIGLYSLSMNFTVIINVFVFSIIRNLFYLFSKLDYKDYIEEYKKLLPMVIKYFSIIMIFIALGISIVSKEITYVLFGSEYLSANNYIIFYMFTYFVMLLGDVIVMIFFNSQGDTKITFNITLLNFIILIPLSIYLTNLFSINGLISSIFISKIISSLYGLKMLNMRYDISLKLITSIRIIGTYVITYIIIHFIDVNILNYGMIYNSIIKIVLYISLTLTAFYVLKIIDKNDVDYLRNFS